MLLCVTGYHNAKGEEFTRHLKCGEKQLLLTVVTLLLTLAGLSGN